jgi:predicted DsbA family dithiol-disulfide isomerase/uncharacterized membrane protein
VRRDVVHWLTLVLVAAAVVASALLFVDYIRPAPVFCEAGGGCEKVRQTVFARPLGIPLPAIGLLGSLAIGFAALLPGKNARKAQLGLAAVGALVAAVLLGVQAVMHTVCPFCAVVDGSSLLVGVLSFVRFREELDPQPGAIRFWGPVAGLVAAVALPMLIGFSRRVYVGAMPPSIVAEVSKTERGKVTLVDFVDFECPFCRETNVALEPLLEEHRSQIRLVRKHVPLRMHPHAMDAAKAGCCGEKMGKGDQMANALFSAPVDDLTPEGCEKLAEKLGLDVNEFRKCVSDPVTTERIDADKAAFKAAKGHGLPTIWIDDTKLEGAQSREELKTAIEGAIRRL